jgi:hypothetical protein
MTSRSISEGLTESADSEIVGKDSPFIESVRGICEKPSCVYSDSLASVQGFSDIFVSPLIRSEKRLNKMAENRMFILKGKNRSFPA